MAAVNTQGEALCPSLTRLFFITSLDSPRSLARPTHVIPDNNLSTTIGYWSCDGSENDSDMEILTNVLASTSIM